MTVGAGRKINENETYWRVTQFVTPCWTLIPADNTGRNAQAWVPIDDENSMSFAVSWNTERSLTPSEITELKNGKGIHAKTIQGTFKPFYNKENDYMLNRKLQASGVSYTGIPGVSAQDSAVIESTRGIPDRTREHLGTSDIGIIQVRKFLMDAARKLHDEGTAPVLDTELILRLRSATGVLRSDVHFYEGFKDKLKRHDL